MQFQQFLVGIPVGESRQLSDAGWLMLLKMKPTVTEKDDEKKVIKKVLDSPKLDIKSRDGTLSKLEPGKKLSCPFAEVYEEIRIGVLTLYMT